VASGESIDEAIKVMLDVGRELHKDPFWGEMILADLEMAGVEKWGDASLLLRARLMTQPMKQADVRREYLRRLKIAFDRRHRDESVAAVGLKTPALSHPSAAG
jgi:small conductance mechanosensitive channel